MKPTTSLLPKDLLKGFVKGLFPEGTSLQVKHLEMTSEDVTLVVASRQLQGPCPLCGEPTSRVHSRYKRMLPDLPFGGRRVRLTLHARRFFCANPSFEVQAADSWFGTSAQQFLQRYTWCDEQQRPFSFAHQEEPHSELRFASIIV